MTVKRSPFKVGQKLTVAEISSQAGRTTIPSKTGGFVITAVQKHNNASGAYQYIAKSIRKVEGTTVECCWFVTFPALKGRKTRKAYASAFRLLVATPEPKPYIPRSERVVVNQSDLSKTVPAGDIRNKRIVLADFLEE